VAPYTVPIEEARARFSEYEFLASLTPSAQKAAFHVRERNGERRHLCLKLIAPNFGRDRLEREILALQAVGHPNVVRLIEYVFSSREGEQKHYIVEEFIDGTDLSERLVAGEPWSPLQAAEFFGALCDGLYAFAEQGIVHRDLKPSNIRVRPDGSPVIIDFGLARHLDLPDLTRTELGARIGTPTYFSPEQFTGTKRDIDVRTDLFAVGILMHEALIGRHPFWVQDMNLQELAVAVCKSEDFREAAEFRALPREWQILIGRLLAKHRAKRPAGPGQVRDILRKLRGRA